MPYRLCLKLAAIATVAALIAAAIQAWRADRRDRTQLAAELAATKQLLTAADARQRDRDTQLAQTLSALEAQKRAALTPAQIADELAKRIPLPDPLTFDQPPAQPPKSRGATNSSPTQESDKPQALPDALIPHADLRPLYDFTLDCQACQAKLSVAQNDLADEKGKTAALIKERDDAVRIAKGGSAWRRVARAAKWFLLGAAAGAVVAKTR